MNKVITFFALAFVCTMGWGANTETCRDHPTLIENDPAAVEALVKQSKLRVLTFAGYSGAGYEHPDQMLKQAARELDKRRPEAFMVNIGATPDGIGAIYRLAKSRGYKTMGIVSSLAKSGDIRLSPCVDQVYFIEDSTWGGVLSGSTQLSPTSAAMVRISDEIIGLGGGDIARDEMLAARASGKPVTYIPADMNHRLAIEKAKSRGKKPPTDFKGTAHAPLTQHAGDNRQP
jgi:hypothetical protein